MLTMTFLAYLPRTKDKTVSRVSSLVDCGAAGGCWFVLLVGVEAACDWLRASLQYKWHWLAVWLRPLPFDMFTRHEPPCECSRLMAARVELSQRKVIFGVNRTLERDVLFVHGVEI